MFWCFLYAFYLWVFDMKIYYIKFLRRRKLMICGRFSIYKSWTWVFNNIKLSFDIFILFIHSDRWDWSIVFSLQWIYKSLFCDYSFFALKSFEKLQISNNTFTIFSYVHSYYFIIYYVSYIKINKKRNIKYYVYKYIFMP